jgi:hypothetical protein
MDSRPPSDDCAGVWRTNGHRRFGPYRQSSGCTSPGVRYEHCVYGACYFIECGVYLFVSSKDAKAVSGLKSCLPA